MASMDSIHLVHMPLALVGNCWLYIATAQIEHSGECAIAHALGHKPMGTTSVERGLWIYWRCSSLGGQEEQWYNIPKT